MTTATAPTITETRYAKLKSKLRELFELDKADLDFGIYRIMAAKNTEVTDFLDRQLKDKVRATLAEHGSGELNKIKTELDETIANLRDNAVPEEQIESNTKVVGLRTRLEAAGGKTGEELEADIYNHLLNFFSRYYDEGDFISQRRYKGDTYAIPYSGEEVTLHWANKDQYYIKSGEWHKDYRFKLPNGKRVQFALVDATQETGNNKEADESKRRYILVDDNPVLISGDTLTLRFHFKAPSDVQKDRANGEGEDTPPVAIFGGKYAKSTKGDERERFCADAEQRAIPHIPAEWAKLVLDKSATDAKPERTLLGKHLDAFTARNTFDYFIHKDLGGFLSRELDFYIKNEVVRLDDLDTAPVDHLQRIQGRVKAIRAVASSIIDLLASIENFQKKLWLKKKFVLNTSWLITIDRIPESLRDVVADNQSQWDEWQKLGFKPKDDEIDGLFEGIKWGTRAYLGACDKLVVDTRLFDEAFTAEVLASEETLSGSPTHFESVNGTLMNSDNFHGINLITQAFSSAVKCIHIDPPYNTNSSDFFYKNKYQSSSWITMMENRLDLAVPLLSESSTFACHIDEYELENLNALLDSTGLDDMGTMVWDKGMPITGAVGLATQHEYVLWRSNGTPSYRIKKQNVRAMKLAAEKSVKSNPGSIGDATKSYREWLRDNRNLTEAEKTYNSVDVNGDIYRSDNMSATDLRSDPKYHKPLVHPVTQKPCPVPRNGFRYKPATIEQMQNNGLVLFGDDHTKMPRKKTILSDDSDSQMSTLQKCGGRGKFDLDQLGLVFPFAHPVVFYDRIHGAVLVNGDVVVDFFAGSGTTAHSLLNLQHSGSVSANFVLIESGKQYSTTLTPRVAKVIFSPDWKSGQAQSHDQGLSALVKCFAVESYEDALNNLPAATGGIFEGQSPDQTDELLKYSLDLEMGPNLLDLDIFKDPWGHTINAQLAGDDEIKRHKVDLIETFNYLLGLKVSAYGPIERYSAEFERSEHKEDLGRLKLNGRLKRDPEGPFKFHRVEGILNDESNTRVLVVWRTLTDDPEKDAAALDAWLSRHKESTTERSEHADYNLIYVNGSVTRQQPDGYRKVIPIEEAFKQKMFEDTDGVS